MKLFNWKWLKRKAKETIKGKRLMLPEIIDEGHMMTKIKCTETGETMVLVVGGRVFGHSMLDEKPTRFKFTRSALSKKNPWYLMEEKGIGRYRISDFHWIEK